MFTFRALFVGLLAVPCLSAAWADDPASADIVRHITADKVNTINQPDALRRLLVPVVSPSTSAESPAAVTEAEAEAETSKTAPVVKGRTVGYRVQVFSDNNSRTAKNEARSKSRDIASRFPQYRTYVMYTSPYWRLKVGDFRTQHEANEAAEELRRAFPAYSKEIRVVRDRITVSE